MTTSTVRAATAGVPSPAPTSVARPSRGRRPADESPAPERSSAFSHLSLEGLRTYRRALVAEEGRVSYWRRLIQVRLDIVRRGAPDHVDARALSALLHEDRSAVTRRALVTLLPDDQVPPLPDLGRLWARDPSGDPDTDARLAHELSSAEAQLSAYRSSLHRRLSAATAELIARYREDPRLCLSALPAVPPTAARPVTPARPTAPAAPTRPTGGQMPAQSPGRRLLGGRRPLRPSRQSVTTGSGAAR